MLAPSTGVRAYGRTGTAAAGTTVRLTPAIASLESDHAQLSRNHILSISNILNVVVITFWSVQSELEWAEESAAGLAARIAAPPAAPPAAPRDQACALSSGCDPAHFDPAPSALPLLFAAQGTKILI